MSSTTRRLLWWVQAALAAGVVTALVLDQVWIGAAILVVGSAVSLLVYWRDPKRPPVVMTAGKWRLWWATLIGVGVIFLIAALLGSSAAIGGLVIVGWLGFKACRDEWRGRQTPTQP